MTAARFSLGRAEATGAGRLATTAVESVDMVSPMSCSEGTEGFGVAPIDVMLYRCYTHYKKISDPV